VIASDGGAPFHKAARLRTNVFSQSLRTTFTINDHVGRLRRRTLVHELETGQRLGALWTISTTMDRYDAPGLLPCRDPAVHALAAIKTRLRRVPREVQHRLINWGYASADAGIRTYVERSLAPPTAFPYDGGIG
jgi:NTE family protein